MKKFVNEHTRIITIIILIIWIITGLISYSFLAEVEKKFINIISLFGSLASFFGLLIAYIQIISLKQTTEITQDAITQTKEKIILKISLSDVEIALSYIKEIEDSLGSNNYDLSRARFSDLKEKILQFKKYEEFIKILSKEQIDAIVDSLDSHIKDILYKIYSDDEQDIEKKEEIIEIFKELQTLSNKLIEFKNNIKFS